MGLGGWGGKKRGEGRMGRDDELVSFQKYSK